MPETTTTPDAAEVAATDKLHWATKARLAREAAAREGAAPPEASPAPAKPPQAAPASDDGKTWEKFCEQFPWIQHVERVLDHGLSDRAAFNIANYGEGRGNGLLGKVQQLYRVKFMCWREGPSAVAPGGVDLRVSPDGEDSD